MQICDGEDLAFHIVDLTFLGQWDLFQVPCQPRSSGGFACLGSPHSCLATHTGATIEVEVARCKNCSSKLCLSFDQFQPDLYGRRGCTSITTLGQLPAIIVSNGPNQGLCSSKNWSCEVVGSLEFFPRVCRFVMEKIWLYHIVDLTFQASIFWRVSRIQVCVGEDLAFHIVDLTFQGQWDLFQVPCQPRSSGGFACLGSHPGLANCTGASMV